MKANNKRILLLNAVLLVAMLAFSISGCSPATTPAVQPTNPPEATQPPAAQPTAVQPTTAPANGGASDTLPAVVKMPDQIAGGRKVEITVVNKPPDSNPTGLAGWKAQVARFQARYPNVTVTGSDYAYAPDTFAGLVAGKQVPTLFEVYLTDPGKMIDQGVATDLTSYFDANKLQSVFNPNILSIASKDGKIYGIPRFAYAMGLAYNIKMLKDAGINTPPTTWADLAAAAQKLTKRDAGVAGLSFITDGGNATGWHMTTIAYNFGLKNTEIVAKQADGTYKAGFGSGAMVDALNFVKDLRWKYDVLPRENLDWGKNGEALATGRAAMVVMAGDQFTWMRQTYADVDMSQFGFAPLPAGSNGQSVSLVGGNIAMVSSSASADQAEAAVYWRLWTQLDPAEIIAGFDATKQDPNAVVGQPVLPLYTGAYEAAYEAQLGKYANLPVANYKLFLDGVSQGKVGLQPEPLVAGQEFYGSMGAVVSSVLTDGKVDVAKILQDAVATFQKNVLDLLKK